MNGKKPAADETEIGFFFSFVELVSGADQSRSRSRNGRTHKAGAWPSESNPLFGVVGGVADVKGADGISGAGAKELNSFGRLSTSPLARLWAPDENR